MNFFATLTEDGSYRLTTAGYTAFVLLMIVLLLLGCSLFGKQKKFTAKQLVFSAMAIALATVTSMIKLFDMPFGGSVTLLSMLFISLIGYWYGIGGGLTAAVAYGVLQLVIDPYILSIPQMILDYLLAFGALGLSGLFHDKKNGLIAGYLVGVLGRYFFVFLSGVIFFAAYMPDDFFTDNVIIYSLIYNGSYLATEAVITVMILVLPPVAKALAGVKKTAVE